MSSSDVVKKLKRNHYQVYTEIDINAPAEKVWQVLTDFKTMPSWSSSFKGIEGKIGPGQHVTALFKSPMGSKINRYQHTLMNVKDGVQFAWSDPFMLGMTDHHIYRVEPLGKNRSKFIQSDEVKKGLTWLMGGSVANGMLKTYKQFNQELKRQAERTA